VKKIKAKTEYTTQQVTDDLEQTATNMTIFVLVDKYQSSKITQMLGA
jgi:hypothetical protein